MSFGTAAELYYIFQYLSLTNIIRFSARPYFYLAKEGLQMFSVAKQAAVCLNLNSQLSDQRTLNNITNQTLKHYFMNNR